MEAFLEEVIKSQVFKEEKKKELLELIDLLKFLLNVQWQN